MKQNNNLTMLLQDKYYMKFALTEAAKALDQNEFPVGCVIIFDGYVLASGSRKGTASLISCNGAQEKRASEIDHAEIRALRAFEKKISFNNTRIDVLSEKEDLEKKYLEKEDLLQKKYRVVPEECVLYCTMEPCLMCFGAIILSGIKRIVYAFEDPMGGGISCDLSSLPTLYRNSGINIIPNILRNESLKLFAHFFSKKENVYWKNSLLEQYTIEQAKQIIN